ncbi:hypothetical protein M569_02875, partial [Genlisea aurea]
MLFLSWSRPSQEDQKSCIKKSGGSFNYDDKLRGSTAKSASVLKQDKDLADDGFQINHSRTSVGSGVETFQRAKIALQNWRHFSLNWAFVDPRTQIRNGSKFCVCSKVFFPWLLMPLQVTYVKDASASFSFGSGTLQGHLLAGEERFSVSMDDHNNVWYEIVSFSKPANLLSLIFYPYVLMMQKRFALESSSAM